MCDTKAQFYLALIVGFSFNNSVEIYLNAQGRYKCNLRHISNIGREIFEFAYRTEM